MEWYEYWSWCYLVVVVLNMLFVPLLIGKRREAIGHGGGVVLIALYAITAVALFLTLSQIT